ncbi:MAG: UDP-N-acetylmuramoyl-tripeptide--D-alanyl-D-alanine ligase [Clostridiaceae bacterium]|nr:UDP-N-acetylmuramoyl-tripeptide--D-alanyl-D-alanine ligase [Clostridiaceae bacterium]
MKSLSAETISKMVQGKLAASSEIVVNQVSIDTRTLKKGSLFIAIKGERFDGHDYIKQAVANGASLVMVREGIALPDNTSAIFVTDTLKALGMLAHEYRKLFSIPIVAVTGSVGKTSTKEMISAILAAKYNVHKSKGNFNNDIGLPLSVLELDDEHEVAVFEMGMRGFGEISTLSYIVNPDISVITNIGISHIERLGTRQNILKAKLEILNGMKKQGVVILNGDDELLSGLKGLLQHKTLFYGIDENQDIWAYDLSSKGEEGVYFQVKTDKNDMKLFIPAPGLHNVHNALAGIAVAETLNMNESEIRKGLEGFSGGQMRLSIEDKDGIKFINDSYNAAPSSMTAALEVLCEIAGPRRRWAILGDMLELGDWAQEAHKKIGRLVSESGIEYMVAIGSLAKWYVEGAEEDSSSKTITRLFNTASEAKPYIEALVQKGDVLLFKGSRMIKLDILVQELLSEELNKYV